MWLLHHKIENKIIKLIIKLIFLNARNESESKGGAENEMLKRQISQIERNLNFKKMRKLVPIPKKSIKRRRQLRCLVPMLIHCV